MSHTDISGLVRDFLLWLDREPRSYAAAIEAWRTSCPRLTVWEDAMEQGLAACRRDEAGTLRVTVTEQGRRLLHQLR
ncbi:hypothetical protein [Sabulicella glaciei]|uniref:MarR family transcriptional regulator n=1 Tax=Sabulicella glaciei TaxID=2984948 RepID=A0ABT3NVK7_9PROT|nr:hypothetical protein [Roseococcus sp. MDT2-1-1]MCW8086194.1 hypothetical protein [Roseococcus sp. MDT2-1-1]